jgi:hypothetical protein
LNNATTATPVDGSQIDARIEDSAIQNTVVFFALVTTSTVNNVIEAQVISSSAAANQSIQFTDSALVWIKLS